MRRLFALVMPVVLVMAAGCRAVIGGGAEPGAVTSETAVSQFLAGARAQDLQAMSAVWGNAEGPVRDRVERQELERRLLIMVCHLKHDESRIEPAQMGEAGRTVHRVELKAATKQAATTFTTVRNTKSGRWFVEEFDLAAVRSLCATAPD